MVDPISNGKRTVRIIPGIILGNLTAGVAVLDQRGKVLISNHTFRRLFGDNPSLDKNSSFLAMLQLSSGTELHRLLESFSHQISKECLPISASALDGSVVSLLCVFSRIKAKTRLIRDIIICELFDITKIKTRPGTLSPAQQRLIETGETTARLIHILKGGALTESYILDDLRKKPEGLPAAFPLLESVNQRRSALIANHLKIGSRREVDFREINLPATLEEVINLPEIKPKLKDIEVRLQGSCSAIEGDARQLIEAFSYFIDNAIDAIRETGKSDGIINIEIKEERTEFGEITISISDNGCGIPPDKLPRIFQIYYTTKVDGSGIGLPMAQKIIEEIHGGKINVTSQVGAGTTFRLHFPHRPPQLIFMEKPGEKMEETSRFKEQQTLIEAGKNLFRVVHAIKNAMVILRLDLLLLERKPTLKNLREALPTMTRAAQGASTMIEEILNISSKKETDFREFDLLKLIDEVLKLPEMVLDLPGMPAKLKDIEVSVSGATVPIQGVRELIREALICLIVNACESIHDSKIPAGKISISVTEIKEGAERGVSLSIQDNGCGIPPENIPLIFKAFYTTKKYGSGIGLLTVRKVVEETHGGKINVTSQVGAGTTFTLFLPYEPSKTAAEEKPIGDLEKIQ
jgi:signal transduction histidine kinase